VKETMTVMFACAFALVGQDLCQTERPNARMG